MVNIYDLWYLMVLSVLYRLQVLEVHMEDPGH